MRPGIRFVSIDHSGEQRSHRLCESDVYFRLRQKLYDAALRGKCAPLEEFVSDSPSYLVECESINDKDMESYQQHFFEPEGFESTLNVLSEYVKERSSKPYMSRATEFLAHLHECIEAAKSNKLRFHLLFEQGAM